MKFISTLTGATLLLSSSIASARQQNITDRRAGYTQAIQPNVSDPTSLNSTLIEHEAPGPYFIPNGQERRMSSIWAGAIISNPPKPNTYFEELSVDFIVPNLKFPEGGNIDWKYGVEIQIGLDGATIQETGTRAGLMFIVQEHDKQMWYRRGINMDLDRGQLHDNGHKIIMPGDHLTLGLRLLTQDEYTCTLLNHNRGEKHPYAIMTQPNKPVENSIKHWKSEGLTAQWIVKQFYHDDVHYDWMNPSNSHLTGLMTLADFGQINLTNAYATLNDGTKVTPDKANVLSDIWHPEKYLRMTQTDIIGEDTVSVKWRSSDV